MKISRRLDWKPQEFKEQNVDRGSRRVDPPGVESVQEFRVSEVPAKGPTAKIEPN